MKLFSLVISRLELFSQHIAEAILGFLMFYLTIAAIIRRLGKPLPGCFEISSEYLLVAIIFLSVSYSYRKGWFIKIDYFASYIPKKIYPFVKFIDSIIGFILFSLISYQAYIRSIRALVIGKRSTSILAYPLAPSYFIVAFGTSILCLCLLNEFIDIIMIIMKKKDKK